ncbi:hypothetical protein [Streptomyces sp. NPDC055107]
MIFLWLVLVLVLNLVTSAGVRNLAVEGGTVWPCSIAGGHPEDEELCVEPRDTGAWSDGDLHRLKR